MFDWDDHEKSGQRQTEMKDEMIRIGPFRRHRGQDLAPIANGLENGLEGGSDQAKQLLSLKKALKIGPF